VTVHRSVLVATCAAALAFLCNFCFQIVAGRYLGSSAYGLLSVLLVGVSTTAVAFSGLQYSVTRELVTHPSIARPRQPFDRFSRTAIALSLIVVATTVIFSGPAAEAFSTGRLVIWLVALSAPSAALLAVVNGRYQGTSRVHWISILSALLSASKLLLATIVLLIGFGVTSVMVTLVTSTTAVVAATFWATRASATVDSPAWSKSSWRAIITQVAFWLLVSLPIVIARIALSESAAGNISIAETIAQISLFLPMILFSFIFPRFVRVKAVGANSTRLGVMAVLACLAASTPVAIATALLGPWAIATVFGGSYRAAEGIVGILAFATLPLVVVGILIQFHLARENWTFTILLCIVLALGTLVLMESESSVQRFAWGTMIVNCSALVVLFPYRKLLATRTGRGSMRTSYRP
jgi:O-antigen/teichoic acid export membrane protein